MLSLPSILTKQFYKKTVPIKKKYYFTLLTILMLFATFPLVIKHAVLGNYVNEYTQKFIGEARVEKLRVLSVSTQNEMDSLSTSIMQFSVSDKVRSIAVVNKYSDIFTNANYLLDVNAVNNKLNNMLEINNEIDRLSIYINDTDYYISSDQGLKKMQTLGQVYWYDYITEYRVQKMTQKDSTYTRSYPLYYFNADLNKMIFIYHYSLHFPNVTVSVVAEMDESDFCTLLNPTTEYNDDFVFATDGETIISHVDKSFIGVKLSELEGFNNFLDLTKESGYEVRQINGEKKLISYCRNENTGWYIVDITSLEPLVQNVSALMKNMTFITLIIILFGVFFSVVVSNRIYNPLKKFLNGLSSIKGIDIKNCKNEMTYVFRAFDQLSNQKDKLELFYNNHIPDVKEKYIRSYLNGYQHNIDAIDSTIIGFDYPFYCCVCFSIDKYIDFCNTYKQHEQFYIQNLIFNVAKEILKSRYPCEGIILNNNRIAFIINADNNEYDKATKTIINLCEELQEQTSNILDYSFSAGIGNLCNSPDEINLSYYQADEALKEKFLLGYGKVHVFCDDNKHKSNVYPKKKEEYVIKCLRNASDSIEESINIFFDELCNKEKFDLQMVFVYIQRLAIKIFTTLTDEGIPLDNLEDFDFNIILKTSSFENINELKQWLYKFCRKAINYHENSMSVENIHYVRILEYIENNYTKDIDLTSIADAIDLSYSYIRHIFKENCGKSIIGYINTLRINKACELLRTTSISINKVALQVGYNNTQSFMRFFKKQEGVTPGEYRKTHLSKILSK